MQLSGYGESVWKPLLWLLVAVLVLYPWLYGLVAASAGATIRPFELSLTTAVLLPPPPGLDLGLSGALLQVSQRILSPFLALLIALAVRRRFRR